MTGPEDSHSSTRPISVAELLAKNGTIGAPPVGGRRRRRRGDSESVTVAELTGEIPIIASETTAEQPLVTDEPPEAPAATNGAVDHIEEVDAHADTHVEPEPVLEFDELDEDDDDYADAVADYSAHVQQRDSDSDLDFFTPPRRSHYAPRRFQASASVGAEQMSPDPLVEDDDELMLVEPSELDEDDDEDVDGEKDRDKLPSYLRSTAGPLFGGQTVADDLARRGSRPGPEDLDLEDEDEHEDDGERDTAAPSKMTSLMHGTWIVGQCILAVAFGAGLFVAFDQLWKWNNIVALVLSVLVILGLVVGVRVVRKTEDIGSTLIAVAVGALVTLGPLALLQSG
jgi:hypothetical protein